MKRREILGLYREKVFSPGKIEDDAAILGETLKALARRGWEVNGVTAETVGPHTPRPENVLTMAQSPRVLNILEDWCSQGTRVLNSVPSVRNCYRKPLIHLLQAAGIAIPPSRLVSLDELGKGSFPPLSPVPLWLKRGDVHAIEPGDVVSVKSEGDLSKSLEHFRSRGICEVLIQEHTGGAVAKFYGVGGQEFFKAYDSSTGKEIPVGAESLMAAARQAAEVVGLEIYGGDAVLTSENGVVLVDLNDWPSFSRCCQAAAESIAAYASCRFEVLGCWSARP